MIWGRLASSPKLLTGKIWFFFYNFRKLIFSKCFFSLFLELTIGPTSEMGFSIFKKYKKIFFKNIRIDLESIKVLGGGGQIWKVSQFPQTHKSLRNLDWMKWSVSVIWANTFYNLDKYILQFGQIYFTIWTNTFHNLDKNILQFWELCKYILQCSEIYFTILTNIFYNFENYTNTFYSA